MAKRIITTITDDLTGGDADETLSFALDGMGYEIDLNAKNAARVRTFLSEFIEAGTRTGRVGSGAQLTRHRPASGVAHPNFQANRQLNQAIREWASANGYPLNDRGRIPQHIVDAYHQNKPNHEAATLLADEALTAASPAKKTAKKAAPKAAFKAV